MRFQLAYSSHRSCYLKHVLSSCHSCLFVHYCAPFVRRISFKSSLSTESVYHTISPESESSLILGPESRFFRAGVGVQQNIRTPHPCCHSSLWSSKPHILKRLTHLYTTHYSHRQMMIYSAYNFATVCNHKS